MVDLKFKRNKNGCYIINNEALKHYTVTQNMGSYLTMSSNFWLVDKKTEERVLVKTGFFDDYRPNIYGEMLFSKFAENNNFGSAKTDVATNSYGELFLLSKDVVPSDSEGLSLMQFATHFDIEDNFSTVNGIVNSIKKAIKDMEPVTLDKNIRKDLLKVALVDFLTVQEDRNQGNLMLEFSGGYWDYKLNLCSLFDNERVFSFEEASFMLNSAPFELKPEDFESISKLFASKNLPKMGIKTELATNYSEAYSIKGRNNSNIKLLNIFINELAYELKNDQELMKFYNEINFDAKTCAKQIQEESGLVIPEGYLYVAQCQFDERKKMLESALMSMHTNEMGEDE